MSERIKPRLIEGKGTASEILYEFHGRFAKATEGVVYYHLVDNTQTSTVRRLSNGEILTLPYKIVFSEKIKVTGNDLATLKANSAYAKNVAFARSAVEEASTSTAVTVGISYRDPKEACMSLIKGKTKVFYTDSTDFSLATLLTEDEGMTMIVEDAVYIASDSIIRYWNGKNFNQEFLDVCEK
jgi:hypothetical protein